MIPEAYRIWSNAICAVVKSDGKVHSKEWLVLNKCLHQEDLTVTGIDKSILWLQIQEGLSDSSINSEKHFLILSSVLKDLKTQLDQLFLTILMKICRIVAFEVNQMNKSELIMLSRIEHLFKKF